MGREALTVRAITCRLFWSSGSEPRRWHIGGLSGAWDGGAVRNGPEIGEQDAGATMSGPERESSDRSSLAELFDRLLDLPDAAARAGFLERLEERDPGLSNRLRRLLAAHMSAETGRFLENCAAEVVARFVYHGRSDITLGPGVGLVKGDAPTLVSGRAPKPILAPAAMPDRIAHYQLLQCIGQGGMGWVYQAVDQKLGRVVALKVSQLVGPDASVQVRTLYDEAKLAAQLDHPNIISVYDAGFDGEWQYVAMQFVEGETLAHVLRRGALSPRVAAMLVRVVAQAVHYAHEQGVVHRDIKPGNILLARGASWEAGGRGAGTDDHLSLGVPRIGDFGLARPLNTDDTITQTTVICGTPSYMAPEQATSTSQSIDRRTDVYSLGAVLYACLTGVPPFEGATPLETVCKLLEEDPVPVRKRNRAVPADLDLIVRKCLRKEPELRYQTAEELVQDLDRYLNDQPVLARKGAFLYRCSRWCKRQRASLAVLAVLALLLGALGVVTALAISSGRRAQEEMATVRAELGKRRRASLLAEAAAAAQSIQPGKRLRALLSLKRAEKLGDGADIRDAAGYSLQLFDIQVEKEWNLAANDEGVVISPDLTRFVTFGIEGDWALGRMETHEIVRRFDSLPHGRTNAALSKGGRYLAVYDASTGSLSVLRCADGSAVVSVGLSPGSDAFCFHPVHGQFFAQLRDGSLARYDLDGPESQLLTRAPPCRRLLFNASGTRIVLVLRDRPAVDVLDLDGRRLHRVRMGEVASTAALDRGAGLLAVGHPSGQIDVWQLGDSPRMLRSWRGHDRWVNVLAFLAGGNVVVSRSWDGTTAYWDVLTGRKLLQTSYGVAGWTTGHASRHAFWTNTAFGLLRTVPPAAWREIQGDEGELFLNWWAVDFVDAQGLLLCGGARGIYLWDVWNRVGLGWIERRPVDAVVYLASTSECIYAAGGAVWARKLSVLRTGERRRVVVGRAVPLYDGGAEHVRFGVEEKGGSLLITSGGKVLCLRRGPGFVTVCPIGHHTNANGGVVGPEAGWFLTQTWGGKGVLLWRSRASRPVNLWPNALSTMVGVFPRGDVAWASTGRRFRFWNTESWEQIAVLDREELTDFPGALAVSESTGLMAVAVTRTEMRLITRPAELQRVLALRSPFPGDLRQIAFDTTGRFVAAATNRSVQLWDLQRLRREFGRLGIECGLPPFRFIRSPITPCELVLDE